MTAAWIRPLAERRMDWMFIVGFSIFALTSFGVDRLAALDEIETHGRWSELLIWYGRTFDPLFLSNPQWLRVMSGISAYVFGPFYLVLAYAFWRGHDAIRVPALIYATAILYSMAVHIWMEFFGDLPSPRPATMMLFYLPYLVLPIALIRRMARPDPFRR